MNDVVRTVIITGVSRGIGEHLALRFLKEGYKVIGLSRTNPSISHDRFTYIKIDLRDLKEILSLKEKIDFTTINGIINNAGIHGPIGNFEGNDINLWIDSFVVNLFGAATLTQLCIPSLRKNHGFIIFFSGGGSAISRPKFSSYSCNKTSVVRFAENLADELYPDVGVYCIAPGPNNTGLLEEAKLYEKELEKLEVCDFKEPEDLCVFLAGNTNLEYSGKFIHVKDDYRHWDARHFNKDMYKLRRTKVI